ncbi:MAG: hypothetical protein IKR76_07365, partial [Ruminococcus sp.]|nr:hypothetical protein [Ruminococcus sp.]
LSMQIFGQLAVLQKNLPLITSGNFASSYKSSGESAVCISFFTAFISKGARLLSFAKMIPQTAGYVNKFIKTVKIF